MTITVQQFIQELRNERLDHYVPLYDGKSYTFAVYRENDFRIGVGHISYRNRQEREFNDWCKENCDGKWVVHNECWILFELDTDTMAFKLRWI